MESLDEKLFLLKQLIEFAKVDGVLHDREMDFLKLLAKDFGIADDAYYALYKSELQVMPLAFSERVIQLYRLSLLMQCDGVWHEKEVNKLYEIGLMMGLNPLGIKSLLTFLEEKGPLHITSGFLEAIFTNQLN
ncbi:excinuclease ABC subunit B [Flavobacterium agricola]|uniref:Excinuclease ABC subunit B n=1 Tax=Flavobacterium agricola TaxID=2870839 RepID=A0ABY6M1H0_9FLAO|nr:excinuclease ABC subunit B [Flavobacterium agricola]UYW02381.1 excinuclease ABC subunit B [Flavobacterium agricola]